MTLQSSCLLHWDYIWLFMHTANKKSNSINEPSEVDETIHYINNHEQGHLSSLSKTTTTKKRQLFNFNKPSPVAPRNQNFCWHMEFPWVRRQDLGRPKISLDPRRSKLEPFMSTTEIVHPKYLVIFHDLQMLHV